jgi:L-threonylcarbamoyladenylate synthase
MSAANTPLQHSELIDEAAAFLNSGGLVAFPTETVYGLGADAQNRQAIEKVFATKGRPANHPLIVHLAVPEQSNPQIDWVPTVAPWARDISEDALRLMNAFWPGPLTLVLKKEKRVLDALTGGQDTVAIRVPAHPIAQELLRKFGGGVVAPSANRFGKISPTSASDVRDEFKDVSDLMVLDGGNSQVGIESTIIDFSSGDHAILLRPGVITPAEILSKTGVHIFLPNDQRLSTQANHLNETLPRVSGSLKAHYAPTTPLGMYAAGRVLDALSEFVDTKSRVVVATWDSESSLVLGNHPAISVAEVIVPSEPKHFASKLYRTLRDLDQQGWDLILMPEPPRGEEWDGVRDRLQRACFGSGPPSISQESN